MSARGAPRRGGAPTQSLDSDTLCIIFSSLDYFSLIRCSSVCKSWSVTNFPWNFVFQRSISSSSYPFFFPFPFLCFNFFTLFGCLNDEFFFFPRHNIIFNSRLLKDLYCKRDRDSAGPSNASSPSSETSMKMYLEGLAIEQHRLSLLNGSVEVHQWKGHTVGYAFFFISFVLTPADWS